MSVAGSDPSSTSSTKGPFTPLEWTGFFQTKRQVSIPKGLDSTEITFTLYEINGGEDKGDLPVILLHHGAGHCALSFAATARELGKLVGDRARIISYDARGHGETISKDQLNLDIERLSTDVRNVIWTLFGGAKDPEGDQDGQEAFIPTKIDESKLPKLFMVGHSMGGAIVTNVIYRGLLPNAVGIAVLDIVEVVKPYAYMAIRQWCETRPSPCKTVEEAVQWAMDADVIRNLESARVSFPGMIV
ncbi:Protein phosphatase methylesterase 1, partial [Mortierella sp. NVP85]